MEYLKDRTSYLAIISLLLTGFLYIFFSWTPTGSNFLFQIQDHRLHSPNPANNTGYRDELDQQLAETSTANMTVIIVIVNKAYVEGDKSMLDLFLDSLWLGENTRPLLDHVLLVAMDETSFERCKFMRLHCYKIESEGMQHEEHVYMSEGFVKMMWRRTFFLGDVLRRGYSFIFSDMDIMWLRDPFLRLSSDLSEDLQISTDRFNRDQWSQANPMNTGFYMMRSNNKTIALYDMWYSRRNNSSGMTEQDVFQAMMREGVFRQLGLKVRFLDTVFFSGFCSDSRDVRVVCTVHANCCRTIKAKFYDLLQVLHDWKTFLSLPTNDTVPFGWSRHVACQNSWR